MPAPLLRPRLQLRLVLPSDHAISRVHPVRKSRLVRQALALLLFAIVGTLLAFGQSTADSSGRTNWYAFPVLYDTPETSLGGGAAGGDFIPAFDGRPSTVQGIRSFEVACAVLAIGMIPNLLTEVVLHPISERKAHWTPSIEMTIL